MRELGMQGSNGTLSSTDQTNLDNEFKSLKDEIGRIQDSTSFNGIKLIASTSGGASDPASVSLQVGLGGNIGATGSDTISVNFNAMDLSGLIGTYAAGSTTGGADLTSAANAQTALGTIDTAIQTVSTSRAAFGAAMNRLSYASNTIQTMSTNMTAANGRIVDVDVASETATMSKNQVLSQAGISVLAQANQIPQMAFGLLK
jgi:flagellin